MPQLRFSSFSWPLAPLLMTACFAVSCAHATIEGTTIEDTDDNRAIYQLLGKLAEGLRSRNADAVLSVVAPSYFEDMGTEDGGDDYGYVELKERILPDTMNAAQEVYVDMAVHEIVVVGDQAHADMRYASRARIRMPAGDTWAQNREFNRVSFARIEGRWWVTSGL